MDYSILIALLRAKPYLTDLEKDILDTWETLWTRAQKADRETGC